MQVETGGFASHGNWDYGSSWFLVLSGSNILPLRQFLVDFGSTVPRTQKSCQNRRSTLRMNYNDMNTMRPVLFTV